MSVVRAVCAWWHSLNKLQHKVLPPVVLLGLVVLILRWAATPQKGMVWTVDGDDASSFTQLDDAQIARYIDNMEDGRSDACKEEVFIGLGDDKISIILDFVDEEFYDLKLTLEALLRHTPDHMYEEILILDDGSDQNHKVMNEALKFLADDRFKKVKAFRSDKRDGPALSRFKASQITDSSMLVFLSSRTAVNAGWLEPLIEQIRQDPTQIAVSHMDSLLSDYRYFKTPDNLINVFNWRLTTLFMETDSTQRVLLSPVMTGDVFAVDAKHFQALGNYDDSLPEGHGGGENLELSLRAWMCGGSVAINTCSRVAVRSALQPLEIKSSPNFRRVTEMWLPDPYKQNAYRVSGTNMDMSETESQSLRLRRRYMEKLGLQCGTFHTYLREVAPHMLVPPSGSRGFGKLRSNTGYCVMNQAGSHGEALLQMCRPHLYEPAMVLNADYKGRFAFKEVCVELHVDQALLKACEEDVAPQQFKLTKLNQIQSLVDSSKCLTHSTTDEGLHYLSVHDCIDDIYQKWSFIKY